MPWYGAKFRQSSNSHVHPVLALASALSPKAPRKVRSGSVVRCGAKQERAAPLERRAMNPSDSELKEMLLAARTIAMVGASSKPQRPSHGVFARLVRAGYRVIPVNPFEATVHGEKAYPALADVPEPIDIVDVFRRAEETPSLADAAVRAHAKVLWLQLGIVNDEAARRARAGGLVVVMDACLAVAVLTLRIQVG